MLILILLHKARPLAARGLLVFMSQGQWAVIMSNIFATTHSATQKNRQGVLPHKEFHPGKKTRRLNIYWFYDLSAHWDGGVNYKQVCTICRLQILLRHSKFQAVRPAITRHSKVILPILSCVALTCAWFILCKRGYKVICTLPHCIRVLFYMKLYHYPSNFLTNNHQ